MVLFANAENLAEQVWKVAALNGPAYPTI